MSSLSYVGEELDLFAAATNWKAYWRSHVQPFVNGDVLEVGAGLGTNTLLLCSGRESRWLCLEPDQRLATRLQRAVRDTTPLNRCEVMTGTLSDLHGAQTFDSILYIDVLEHIEHDRIELSAAADRLRDGGRLVVLAPAHQWLFSPFDRSIGHFRRYTAKTLSRLTPPQLTLERAHYLDSVGMLASLGNKVALRNAMPTAAQIRFWDQRLVPCSVRLDRFLNYRLGKSVLMIWRKPPRQA